MEILIRNTTEAMKEMMALVKSEKRPPTNINDMSKGKKRNKGRKMQNVQQRTNL
jgi:hypothetical protein